MKKAFKSAINKIGLIILVQCCLAIQLPDDLRAESGMAVEQETYKLILWGGELAMPARFALRITRYGGYEFDSNGENSLGLLGTITIGTQKTFILKHNTIIETKKYSGFQVHTLRSNRYPTLVNHLIEKSNSPFVMRIIDDDPTLWQKIIDSYEPI